MDEILRSLGHLFVQTIPTVIFVFLLLVILERLLFRPLSAVLKQREEASIGALERAKELTDQVESKIRYYEAALQAARQEVYRQQEADRRETLSQRDSALKRAREEAELQLQRARAELGKQVEVAKQDLGRAAESLAEEIAGRILDSPLAAGDKRRADFRSSRFARFCCFFLLVCWPSPSAFRQSPAMSPRPWFPVLNRPRRAVKANTPNATRSLTLSYSLVF
jgi:F-type H+-transporting ATPase subunit b